MKESPTVYGSLFRQSVENPSKPIIAFTAEECLALIFEMKFTQRQYKKLRQKEKKKNAKLLVSWDEIIKLKKKCEPENIDSTTIGEVSVPMQSVVDHQASSDQMCPMQHYVIIFGHIHNH